MTNERNSGDGGDEFGAPDEDRTAPGGPADVFAVIARSLDGAVAALRESAELAHRIEGDGRWTALRHVGLKSQQLAEVAFDFGRLCHQLAREEELKPRKGIP